MEIKIWRDEQIGTYSVSVNDETILECLGAQEVDELTVGEIKRLMEG